jgi:HK97 gp10 family phage protein
MAIRGNVKGLIAARKAFKALAPEMQAQLSEATERTVWAVQRRATTNVAIDTGTLRDHIEGRFSARSGFGRVGVKDGRVAIAGKGGSALTSQGARVLEARRYAHMVEFGTSDTAAQPFMMPAAEAERGAYAQRLREAGKRAERNLAGGRFL